MSEPHRVLFLDIETTGLSRYYDELTLVGYAMDGIYRVHIAGDHPGELYEALANAAAVVTFNGTLFDLPFLRKTFGEVPLPATHVDLRYAARRIGLTGGQKAIEHQMGLRLRTGLEDVDGRAAVLLWHRYLRGDYEALRRLIAYNQADVRGMFCIFDTVLTHLGVPTDFFLRAPNFADLFRGPEGRARHDACLPSSARLGRKFTTLGELFGSHEAAKATVVGIDLTGSEARPSGFCILRNAHCETAMLNSDEEIIQRIISARPRLVSIDSPLSLPRGRLKVTDDDPGRHTYGIMRQCERELKRRGINVYPCLLPSMQRLTERGMRLALRLREMGVPTIESYPGAAQDIMGIPRKGAGEALLREGLINFGLCGPFTETAVKHDELDAITSALVATFFLAGKYEALGGQEEDPLIVPHLKGTEAPVVAGISGHIGAGKTTAARILEDQGFAYCRFSEVIDEVIRAEGGVADRRARQSTGWRIHEDKKQRWLCEKVVERVAGASKIVIDGLRFPEDHAYFVERFGSGFHHLHIRAPEQTRFERLAGLGATLEEFTEANTGPTEVNIDQLMALAGYTLDNIGTISELTERLATCAVQLLDRPPTN